MGSQKYFWILTFFLFSPLIAAFHYFNFNSYFFLESSNILPHFIYITYYTAKQIVLLLCINYAEFIFEKDFKSLNYREKGKGKFLGLIAVIAPQDFDHS